MIRKVLYTENGQPFLIAGSGTMGWDATAANVVEAGDDVVSNADATVGQYQSRCCSAYEGYPHDKRPDSFAGHFRTAANS